MDKSNRKFKKTMRWAMCNTTWDVQTDTPVLWGERCATQCETCTHTPVYEVSGWMMCNTTWDMQTDTCFMRWAMCNTMWDVQTDTHLFYEVSNVQHNTRRADRHTPVLWGKRCVCPGLKTHSLTGLHEAGVSSRGGATSSHLFKNMRREMSGRSKEKQWDTYGKIY